MAQKIYKIKLPLITNPNSPMPVYGGREIVGWAFNKGDRVEIVFKNKEDAGGFAKS